jgi:acyl carrier protein
MTAQTAQEATLAKLLVEALNLQGIVPEQIVPTAPLFGVGTDSLGLDSIDALEIALAVQRHYSVELRSDDADIKPAFASLRSLTAHIHQCQAALSA